MDLDYVISHVFLPPKLPQRNDSSSDKDRALTQLVKDALDLSTTLDRSQDCWHRLSKMLDVLLSEGEGDVMNTQELDNALLSMEPGDLLVLHIRSQNAGLIVRRPTSPEYTFESFELSPDNASVIGTEGRLLRTFPGPVIAVNQERVKEANFRQAFTQCVSQLDIQTIQDANSKTRKAKADVLEIRNTAGPQYVTEMLTGILRAIGRPLDNDRICKNTRDDVLWHETFSPWRRSPRWLLLRVALQTSLMSKEENNRLHIRFKSFMVFFMSQILERALKASVSSDTLFIMASKISRRILKLGAAVDSMPWLERIQICIKAVQKRLNSRWSAIEQNPDPLGCNEHANLVETQSPSDTHLSLDTTREYLEKRSKRKKSSFTPQVKLPGCQQRIRQDARSLPDAHLRMSQDSTRLWLIDFEMWVEDHLNTWLARNLTLDSSCELLNESMTRYLRLAMDCYDGGPEDFSVLVLTVMDMWMALDKCATYHEPLLLKYETGFQPHIFEPLLLPSRSQMQRLFTIEQYLEKRHEDSVPENPSLLLNCVSTRSFPVQYFKYSAHHQELKRKIEAEAHIDRQRKIAELSSKKAEYQSLLQAASALRCEYRSLHDANLHSTACRKCLDLKAANGMVIEIHEWPLPVVELKAQAAVFELAVPSRIHMWREMTYKILVDLLTPDLKVPQELPPKYTLRAFKGLRNWFRGPLGRLQLASPVKEMSRSHYNSQKISVATELSVCVNNGMQIRIYDNKTSLWTTEVLCQESSIRLFCTSEFPQGSQYRPLHFALLNTSHTTNEILAQQGKCPESLTLHEFYAFAALRSGHRLQWRNIARELVSHLLNFSQDETYQLIVQAAWQAGPRNISVHRDSHLDLKEQEFGLCLLSALDDSLSSVESNWQCAPAVRTYTTIAIRLLSCSSYGGVTSRCLLFLERVRAIVLLWIRDVSTLRQENSSEEELGRLTLQVLDLALTCHGTFELASDFLSTVLDSENNLAALTECAITVNDRCPSSTTGLTKLMKVQLERFFRRARSIESTFRIKIVANPAGANRAIRSLWSGFNETSAWEILENEEDRWMMTTTNERDSQPSKAVHFNFFNGMLLVDGRHLSRLPSAYELHPMYRRLFQKKVLDVVPSTMTGMAFETRNTIHGYQVHFQMFDGDLVIRTLKNGYRYELLPLRALMSDFPLAFITKYIHWLEIDFGSIEFRPLDAPWESSARNWRTCPHENNNFSLIQTSYKLVDIRSPTFKTIARVLSPLEQSQHVHAMFNFEKKIVEIHLPRLNLDFFISENCSTIESKQFRGMVIDSNQSFGSLTGLSNRLVLCSHSSSSRICIVPEGKISYKYYGNHAQVAIDTRMEKHVSYHLFKIDTQLGRLVDSGSLRSRLLRIYLHALTSYCLPDSLTGRTGTEEALCGLEQSSTKSFLVLQPKDIELLEAIENLTPKRVYYPNHLKVMQEVTWQPLSYLSQHDRFLQGVESIFRQAQTLQPFQEHGISYPNFKWREFPELYERARLRNSSFRGCGFGAEAFTRSLDRTYSSRDQIGEPSRELQACVIAKMVDEWSSNRKPPVDLYRLMEKWRLPITGPRANPIVLGFDSRWLEPLDSIIASQWCSLHQALSQCGKEKKYTVMVFLSTLAYSPNTNQDLIQTLLGMATIPEIQQLPIPKYGLFYLEAGHFPIQEHLVRLYERYSMGHHRSDIDLRGSMCVQNLMGQWPIENVVVPIYDGVDLDPDIDHYQFKAKVEACFENWYRNHQFYEYTQKIQIAMSRNVTSAQDFTQPMVLSSSKLYNPPKNAQITYSDLLQNPAPIEYSQEDGVEELMGMIRVSTQPQSIRGEDVGHLKLTQLLAHLSSKATGVYQTNYITDLKNSFEAFRQEGQRRHMSTNFPASLFLQLLETCRRRTEEFYEKICSHLLFKSTSSSDLCHRASMMPRLSPSIILSLLARDKISALVGDWKSVIVSYGIAITQLQRMERLMASSASKAELQAELTNTGHINWDPVEYPDWLLLELENNILIREEQAQTAKEMISPSSGTNSIMQLNMGLGKSSVIVPIVAATLADGQMLARVVVLKSLLPQMFHLLVNRLGGMINRRIFWVPVSRSLKLGLEEAILLRAIYEECKLAGGVFLVQPEHLLSFELLGLDRVLSPASQSNISELKGVGLEMVNTQRWLLNNSRDILDESDEILSVRFELIYTMGTQQVTEFSPDRWTIVESVLGILASVAKEIASSGMFHNGLEVLCAGTSAFPRIRILQPTAGTELLLRVARKICENGLPGVAVWNLAPQSRGLLLRFLTEPGMIEVETLPLQSSVLKIESMKKGLLLLRGLFSGGILNFAFAQKRWRVNYGLDLTRTRLAVPYYAKDSPAARAEFSHPDTALVLTCLSYYYGGLSANQIHAGFEELFQSDSAQGAYEEWIQSSTNFPNNFRQLSGVNLRNKEQCSKDLFPHLKFSKGLIDFYMSHLVFPKEMKEFSHKISASGWEIGREKKYPTTGFSGTNDSRYFLPIPVKQCDLPQQLHTNAAVLDCLLQPENSVDSEFTSGVEVLDAGVLLRMAVSSCPPIKVIIDVGAQVLELGNMEIARKWLSMVPPSVALAAVYCDDSNDLFVLDRGGLREPLTESPFAGQMDRCLVYLDEVHARGTDLRMPTDYRAIVTLGPDLPKDRLVQACMRMRKLGNGQSVMFCGSVEVQLKILQANGKAANDSIEVADILSWCIQNTWDHTRKAVPLWATQGMRHYRRRAACLTESGLPETPEAVLEPESQTLVERYGFEERHPTDQPDIFLNRDSVFPFSKNIDDIREKCHEFGLKSLQNSSLHEEQERELQPENEREVQVERPPLLKPHLHHIHKDVKKFVENGILNRFSPAFQPAFQTFSNIRAESAFDPRDWPQDLLVTADFAQTVENPKDEPVDYFLKPVNWILSGKLGATLSFVIVSPYEANKLLPMIRDRQNVRLHIFTPRLSMSNHSLQDLSFVAIPPVPANWVMPRLGLQINLFSGQLYLQSKQEYMEVCQFLGLCYKAPEVEIRVACDGFVHPEDRRLLDFQMSCYCRFLESPVGFLRYLISTRRKGQGFNASHLGRILNGELLESENFTSHELGARFEAKSLSATVREETTALGPAENAKASNKMHGINEEEHVLGWTAVNHDIEQLDDRPTKRVKLGNENEPDEVMNDEPKGRGWVEDENGVIIID